MRARSLFINVALMLYSKPFLTISDQLALLKSRGLHVKNDDSAQECLHRNGYYRLSAYWYLFREKQNQLRTDKFLPGSDFDDAVLLYQFDKKLKLLLLDALERVEIAVRVEIALVLGQRDTFAHEDPAQFDPLFSVVQLGSSRSKYDDWNDRFNLQVQQSREEFIKHHQSKYGSRSHIPIWIAIELWDFGLLSNAYSGLQLIDGITVASRFNIPVPIVLKSWLHCLNYIRNKIAHHGRLWNVNIDVAPKIPRIGDILEFDTLHSVPNAGTRLYGVCCILSFLTHVINPASPWIKDLKDHIKDFPSMPYASIHSMGFPSDWETHDFWNYSTPAPK